MKQILCFGDSNTYGLVPGTFSGKGGERYGWGIRWTSILAEELREEGCHVIEEGLCGRTTVFEDPLRDGRRGTEMLPLLLETHAPVDLIILMLGTNDCKIMNDASAEVIGMGVERLLGQICRKSPESKVLLMSPIALGDGVWEDGYDPEFNEESVETSKRLPAIYKQIAAKWNISFLAASEYALPSEIDREHMDEEGHRRLAEAVCKKIIQELLKNKVFR